MGNGDQLDPERASHVLANSLDMVEADSAAKALLAIGRIGGAGAFEILKTAFEPKRGLRGALTNSEDDETRRSAAALALGFLRDDRVIDLLLTGLEDPSARIRGAVVAALGRFPDERAVLPLLDALADPECSNVAVEALRQLHRGGLAINVPADKVLDLLGGPDAGAQYRAIAAMCFIRDTRFVAPLIKKLGEIGPKEWILKAKVVEALGMQGDRSVVDTLLGLLRDQIPEVRAAAAVALGNLQDPSAVEPLIGILEDDRHPIRSDAALKRRAIVALGKIGKAEAVVPLATVLRKGDERSKIRAAESLGRIGDPSAIDSLALALKYATGDLRLPLIHALAGMDDAAAVPPLVAALKTRVEEKDETRDAAIQGLEKLGRVAVPGLIEALDDKNVRVRDGVTHVLQALKAKEAFEPLLRVVSDRKSGIQSVAFAALSMIEDPRTEAVVDSGLVNADPQIRSHAIRAIASREAPPLERIVPMLQDPDDQVKAVASSQLLGLGVEHAKPVLMASLGHKNKAIRLQVISELERIGSTAVIEPLAQAVRGLGPRQIGDLNVVLDASAALAKIDDPHATEVLVAIVEEKARTGVIQQRSAIVTALADSILLRSI